MEIHHSLLQKINDTPGKHEHPINKQQNRKYLPKNIPKTHKKNNENRTRTSSQIHAKTKLLEFKQ